MTVTVNLKTILTLVLMIAIYIMLSSIGISSQSNVDIDPAPLAKVFQDVVEAILREDYGEALSLCKKAANISLPNDISYNHEKLYKSIGKVVNLLVQAKELTLPQAEDKVRLYGLLNDLYISKLELAEVMNSYVDKLASLFKDSTTRSLTIRTLMDYILNLDSKLEITLTKITQAYLGAYGQEIHVELNHQPIVYGGETLDLDILLKTNLSIGYANTTIVIVYGGNILSETVQYRIPVNKSTCIKIATPKAEDIKAIGVKPLTQINSKLFVIARAVAIDGRVLYGYSFSNFTLMYLNPPINVFIPSYVKLGEDIKVKIVSNLDIPLNLLIYLNNISNRSLLANLSISSGEYILNLSSTNLSIGYNEFIFLTQPKGKYLAFSFSHTLDVALEKIDASINVKPFIITPFTNPLLEIYVNSPTPYNVTIYFGNNKVVRHTLVDSPKISIELSLPLTIFFWRHRILVEIRPNNPLYSSTIVEGSVYVLNITTLAIITIFLAITATTTSKASQIIATLKLGGSIKNFIYRTKSVDSARATVIEYIFRRPRLLNLYKKIIGILSKYVEPPRVSETLREFYSRFCETFSGGHTSSLVKVFLELYEQDLYSNHNIDIDRAIQIAKRIEEIENK